MVLVAIWWNTNCVYRWGSLVSDCKIGLMVLKDRSSWCSEPLCCVPPLHPVLWRTWLAWVMQEPFLYPTGKVEDGAYLKYVFPAPLFVPFFLSQAIAKNFLLLISPSWMLLLSAQIHQPFLSSLKLSMSVVSVSVGVKGICVATPIWIGGCFGLLRKVVFLPLKSPCRLHGMEEPCALDSNSQWHLLSKNIQCRWRQLLYRVCQEQFRSLIYICWAELAFFPGLFTPGPFYLEYLMLGLASNLKPMTLMTKFSKTQWRNCQGFSF